MRELVFLLEEESAKAFLESLRSGARQIKEMDGLAASPAPAQHPGRTAQ